VDFAETATRILLDRRDQFETRENLERTTASVAHDILTPLNGILTSLSSLQEQNIEGCSSSASITTPTSLNVGDNNGVTSDKQDGSSVLPPRSTAKLSSEQRELVATATYCAEALTKMIQGTRQGCDRGTGAVSSTCDKSSAPANAVNRNLSELISCVLEIVSPLPKQVPLFVDVDPSLPDTMTFQFEEDLTLFRVALCCLSTACERSEEGYILLRVLRKPSSHGDGKPDEILWECHDSAPNISENDKVQLTSRSEVPECRPLDNTSLQGLLISLKLVASVGGSYGYRKSNPNETKGDGKSSHQGSVFWFSIPLPEDLSVSVSATSGAGPIVSKTGSTTTDAHISSIQSTFAVTDLTASKGPGILSHPSTATTETLSSSTSSKHSSLSPTQVGALPSASLGLSSQVPAADVPKMVAAYDPKRACLSSLGSDTGERNAKRAKTSRNRERSCLVALKATIPASFREAMENHGWKCSFAPSGPEALLLLRTRNWDAVVVANSSDATKLVTEFRAWEKKNRFNTQRNVFLQCCDTVGAVDELLSAADTKSSLVLLPFGYDGALGSELNWEDFRQLAGEQEALSPVGLSSLTIINRYSAESNSTYAQNILV